MEVLNDPFGIKKGHTKSRDSSEKGVMDGCSKNSVACDACQFLDQTADASGFCQDCKQNLCAECLLFHKKFSGTREHTIVTLSLSNQLCSTSKIKEFASPMSVLKRCDSHSVNEVKYYCCDHKVVYCTLCRAVKHANCNDKLILEVCNVVGKTELDHALTSLEHVTDGLNKALQERKKQIDEMVAMKMICCEQIYNLKQRMARLFDQLDKNVCQKATAVDKCVNEFTEKATLYEDALTYVTSLSDQIKEVLECSDKETIFAAQTKAQKMKTECTLLVEQFKTQTTPLKLVFNQDAHIVEFLSTCESLGEVDLQIIETNTPTHEETDQMVPRDILQLFLSKKPEHVPLVSAKLAPGPLMKPSIAPGPLTKPSIAPGPLIKPSTAEPLDKSRISMPLFSSIVEANFPKQNRRGSASSSHSTTTTKVATSVPKLKSFLNMRPRSRKRYAIHVESDRGDCDITGSAFLPNGSLIICDHFNKTIKLLDKAFVVLHTRRLSDHPWNVAVMNEGEVVVTLSKTKTVRFVKLESSGMAFNGSFQTKMMCWGIAALEEDKVVITFHDNPGKGAVEIRTRNGQILKQLSNDSDGKALFISPICVAFEPRHKLIYISDGKNNSVICLTTSGDVVSIVKKESLRWPKGILLDEDGNVIVSSHFSDQLKLMREKGHVCVKFCDDCVRPQTLSIRWEDLVIVVGTNVGREIMVLSYVPAE